MLGLLLPYAAKKPVTLDLGALLDGLPVAEARAFDIDRCLVEALFVVSYLRIVEDLFVV